jgi:uncharacterized phage protein (TIGR02216 family)
MAAGLGTLRLPPSAFWRMTPKELDAALRGYFRLVGEAAAPSRAELDQLMQLFPDG